MHPAHPMAPEISYSLAFMTGILGSGHCVGMCGSLVSAFFMRLGNDNRSPLPYLAYHGARIGVYFLIGTTAALIGAALVQTGIVGKTQGILQIIAGLVVILLGLDILGMLPRRVTFHFLPMGALQAMFRHAGKHGTLAGAALGGAVNGFMPCSMTLAMAVQATTAATPLQGGILLLAFGAGTLPSMLFVSALFGRLGVKARGYLLKGAALFVIALGASTVYQGIAYYRVIRTLGNW